MAARAGRLTEDALLFYYNLAGEAAAHVADPRQRAQLVDSIGAKASTLLHACAEARDTQAGFACIEQYVRSLPRNEAYALATKMFDRIRALAGVPGGAGAESLVAMYGALGTVLRLAGEARFDGPWFELAEQAAAHCVEVLPGLPGANDDLLARAIAGVAANTALRVFAQIRLEAAGGPRVKGGALDSLRFDRAAVAWLSGVIHRLPRANADGDTLRKRCMWLGALWGALPPAEEPLRSRLRAQALEMIASTRATGSAAAAANVDPLLRDIWVDLQRGADGFQQLRRAVLELARRLPDDQASALQDIAAQLVAQGSDSDRHFSAALDVAGDCAVLLCEQGLPESPARERLWALLRLTGIERRLRPGELALVACTGVALPCVRARVERDGACRELDSWATAVLASPGEVRARLSSGFEKAGHRFTGWCERFEEEMSALREALRVQDGRWVESIHSALGKGNLDTGSHPLGRIRAVVETYLHGPGQPEAVTNLLARLGLAKPYTAEAFMKSGMNIYQPGPQQSADVQQLFDILRERIRQASPQLLTERAGAIIQTAAVPPPRALWSVGPSLVTKVSARQAEQGPHTQVANPDGSWSAHLRLRLLPGTPEHTYDATDPATLAQVDPAMARLYAAVLQLPSEEGFRGGWSNPALRALSGKDVCACLTLAGEVQLATQLREIYVYAAALRKGERIGDTSVRRKWSHWDDKRGRAIYPDYVAHTRDDAPRVIAALEVLRLRSVQAALVTLYLAKRPDGSYLFPR
ncbi:hypothetical protein [Ramlibacter albus]|uniref:Uncharacterized protein n=1 Tax=Ramlibacter albus TaxID=2079448 RepID=A0A923M833_9BURK|nr:hypothetical protein [Ramlibacter albus]MBC5764623.1 hypothetical protein [Ramlibacter albus]